MPFIYTANYAKIYEEGFAKIETITWNNDPIGTCITEMLTRNLISFWSLQEHDNCWNIVMRTAISCYNKL